MVRSDRVERRVVLPASPGDVWRALTEDLSAWFGAEATIRALRPGGHIEFRFADGSTRAAVIEELEMGRVLSFRWLSFARAADGTPSPRARSRVELVLEPDDDGTALTVLEVGSDTAPASLAPAAGVR